MHQALEKDHYNLIVPYGASEVDIEYLAKATLQNMAGYTSFEIYGIFRLDAGPSIVLPDGTVIEGEHELYAVVFDNYTLPN